MSKTVEAIFDGKVLHPVEPLALEPNTRVWLTIENIMALGDQSVSFLDIARTLDLEGPPDWSEKVEAYLYDRGPYAN